MKLSLGFLDYFEKRKILLMICINVIPGCIVIALSMSKRNINGSVSLNNKNHEICFIFNILITINSFISYLTTLCIKVILSFLDYFDRKDFVNDMYKHYS